MCSRQGWNKVGKANLEFERKKNRNLRLKDKEDKSTNEKIKKLKDKNNVLIKKLEEFECTKKE